MSTVEHRYAAVEQAAVQALTLRGEATADQPAIDVPDLRKQLVTFPGKPYQPRRARALPYWPRSPPRAGSGAHAPPAHGRLKAFGPVSVDDLKWWTGWTPTDTRKAQASSGTQAVELDEGTGHLLAEDLDATDAAP
ncbi:hypothetical protein ACFYZB_20750 [Streptomyces sp. NPDC001852]|uniref:hypothetical protein n=1 Tax=Streptomyces sp. NPDC001852 TaxID=3364619 RepID=UPI0036B5201F